jgi:hypothetical protein
VKTKEIKELSTYIENIGKHYTVPYLDDFVQEVLFIIYERGITFINELKRKDKLYNFTYKVSVYQILSKNGNYYKKYIKPRFNEELKEIKNTKILKFDVEKFREIENNLNGANKKLFQELLKNKNKSEIAKKSKIHYTSLLKMIDRMEQVIRNKHQLNEFYD